MNINENALLTIILAASPETLQSAPNHLPANEVSCLDIMSLSVFEDIEHDRLEQLGFSLSANKHREGDLVAFISAIGLNELNWLKNVKEQLWSDADWNTEVYRHFQEGEMYGITGKVMYAIIAADMTLKRFPVPKGLQARLWGLRESLKEQREQAERERREIEARRKKRADDT